MKCKSVSSANRGTSITRSFYIGFNTLSRPATFFINNEKLFKAIIRYMDG